MSLTKKLLEKLPDVLAQTLPDVKLRDQDVDIELAQGTFTQDNILPPLMNVEGFGLSFEAGGTASIRNFNSPGDKDETGIVGDAPQAGMSDALPPQLMLDGSKGWMRYQLTARIKAAAEADLSFLAGEGQSELYATLADYRAHPLDESMRDAVRADLAPRMRIAALDTDVAKLEQGDALAWQVRGQLRASLELNWADLLTANLASLAFVRGSELLALKVSLQASLSATVGLTDDFLVAFSRPRDGRIQIAVRKVKSRGAGIGANVGLKVGFKDPAAFQKILGELVTALVGEPMSRVDELVAKASKLELNDAQKEMLRACLERLGMDPQLADLASLPQTWQDFKQRVETALKEVSEAQIGASFRSEYLRTSQSSTLLEVVVDDATAMEFHGGLLRGNLVDILDWLRNPHNQGRFELKSFLQQTRLTRQSTTGFSLGLGSWGELKSQSTRKRDWAEQKNFQGATRIAFLGLRAYEDAALGNRSQWAVDFKAEMTQFSSAPVASDFYYGLHLLQWGQQKKLSKAELLNVVDDAVVWGVLDEADGNAVVRQLEGLLDKEPIETRLEMKLDNDAFRSLLPRLQDFELPRVSQALALAMPRSDERPRVSADIRRRIYAPIWQLYLQEVQAKGSFLIGDLSPTRAADIAAWWVKMKDPTGIGKELYLREKTFQPGGAFSFAEVTDKNRNTLSKCRNFMEGLAHLRRAIDERWGPDAIRTVFGKMEGMWNTGFHLRATGALLAEALQDTPMGLARVQRTFTVKRVGHDEQLVFSTTRAPGTK